MANLLASEDDHEVSSAVLFEILRILKSKKVEISPDSGVDSVLTIRMKIHGAKELSRLGMFIVSKELTTVYGWTRVTINTETGVVYLEAK